MDKMFTKIKKKTTHALSLALSLSRKIRISDNGESVQDEAIVVKRQQSLTRKQKTFPGF